MLHMPVSLNAEFIWMASLQVIDVHEIPPESGLEWCHLLPDVSFYVLVCGGDGTIGWVLNAIENLNLKVNEDVLVIC